MPAWACIAFNEAWSLGWVSVMSAWRLRPSSMALSVATRATTRSGKGDGNSTGGAYLSYQPSKKARPRVPLNKLNIIQAGVASLSISILSASSARTAKM